MTCSWSPFFREYRPYYTRQQSFNNLAKLLNCNIKFDISSVPKIFTKNFSILNTRMMIGLIQKMFGNGFWNNVILEATHWNYHNKSIRLRQETNPKITESGWTSELNALFRYFFFLSYILGIWKITAKNVNYNLYTYGQ